LAVVAVSVAVLAFWSLRDSQWLVARRAVSVANANDFSWRNRVAAWEGALQMMAEKPWFGYGWNQPERVYDQFYRPSKVPEGAAIQLNDYFTLGTTLGIPALLCFVIYVSLSLRGSPKSKVQSPKPEAQGPAATLAFSLQPLAFQSACRAGAVVLLVGFWFDGGLFKLAMAAPFWILLELGREDTDCTDLHE
jgi:O-antigen ligase